LHDLLFFMVKNVLRAPAPQRLRLRRTSLRENSSFLHFKAVRKRGQARALQSRFAAKMIGSPVVDALQGQAKARSSPRTPKTLRSLMRFAIRAVSFS